MNRRQIGWAVWPDAFAPTVNEAPDWHAQAAWLAAHADSLAVARRAAAKPALGFVVGPDGSGDDPVLFPDVFPNLHEGSRRGRCRGPFATRGLAPRDGHPTVR